MSTQEVVVETISKKELKGLVSASNLLNGKASDLQDAEFHYQDAEVNTNGYKSYLYENKADEEVKRFNRNALMFTDAVDMDTTVDDKTEYTPLYKLLIEMMGDNDEIQIPSKFKIVHVENAQYTRDNGDKVTRYPLHMYKEFQQEMADNNLTISGLYSRPAKVNTPFFANAKNWTVEDIYKADPDAPVKKVKIQLIS